MTVKSCFAKNINSTRYYDENFEKKMYYDCDYVKISRESLFSGDGVLNTFVNLVSRLAYREGYIKYYKYYNHVNAGEYVGGKGFLNYLKCCDGKVSLKQSLNLMERCGLIKLSKDSLRQTLSFKLNEEFTAKIFKRFFFGKLEKENGTIVERIDLLPAPTNKKGFLCLPRNFLLSLSLPEDYVLTQTDALWDIITSVSFGDGLIYGSDKASVFTPQDEDGTIHNLTTYTYLSKRWNWSRAKVCRFFKKFSRYINVAKVGSNSGSLITLTEDFFTEYKVFDKSYFNLIKEEKQITKKGNKGFVQNSRFRAIITERTNNSCVDAKNKPVNDFSKKMKRELFNVLFFDLSEPFVFSRFKLLMAFII